EIPRFARVLRASTQSVASREYVLAARARGESVRWVAFGEILPGVVPTLLVEAALGMATAVLAIAALSFLGLGVQQPAPNGAVIGGGRTGGSGSPRPARSSSRPRWARCSCPPH